MKTLLEIELHKKLHNKEYQKKHREKEGYKEYHRDYMRKKRAAEKLKKIEDQRVNPVKPILVTKSIKHIKSITK